MDRHEKLDASFETAVLENQRSAVFAPEHAAMGQLCLALTLLWHDLIPRVVLECRERRYLVISVDDALPPQISALGDWSPPTVRLNMSRTALELWLFFGLKYYRDGLGDADHVDIEARTSRTGDSAFDVTFRVPNARPPISADELLRLLGAERSSGQR